MKNETQILVEKIHNEFRTAQTDLEETFEIMKKDPVYNKNERLHDLGFTRLSNSGEVRAIKKMRSIIETIERYKLSHPLNKLITEDQMNEICEKYSLIFGEVQRYTGTIPEKNVIEMEQFKFPQHLQKQLFICAPLKDMFIGNREQVVNRKIVYIPDPVVLLAVENNLYMVVTAWGAEGKDEIIFNEKMN